MSNDTPTTGDVRSTLNANLNSVEVTDSTLGGGVQATVSEQEIGQFYRTMRQNDYEFSSRRLGDTLVAQIEAEEQSGLGGLLG